LIEKAKTLTVLFSALTFYLQAMQTTDPLSANKPLKHIYLLSYYTMSLFKRITVQLGRLLYAYLM